MESWLRVVETVLLIGSMFAALTLVALLTTKEAVLIMRPKGFRELLDELNAAIVPVMTLFVIVILLRLGQIFAFL